ncbi:MAG: cell division protein FtsW (lipid II flippase) [Verrucomicrobiales bacterium]|jgi:cell division protein FtsW (lipid II flippase)
MPADLLPFFGVVLGLLLAAHLVVRRFAPLADPTILPIVALLNGLGYVFIARLANDIDDATSLPGQQATWTAVGIAAFTATLLVVPRIKVLDKYRYLAAITGIVLLILPLVPGVGREFNGARIWVKLGPINFQPGEFAKIALAVFVASYLAEKRQMLQVARLTFGPFRIPEPKHLAPVIAAWGVSLIVMVAEKDLGSSLLLFLLVVLMLWVATSRASYLVTGVGLFMLGGWLASKRFTHVQDRLDIWLDPFADPDGVGFQPVEASFALANGGLTGTGPGRGEPYRIPEVETDFIFAAIGEELGLVGSVGILIAFVAIVTSGLRIAIGTRDDFGKLLATGLSALIGIQAFIIIGGVIRIVPLTGITLPFVSYGGSSLVANYVLIALILRISHDGATRPDVMAKVETVGEELVPT